MRKGPSDPELEKAGARPEPKAEMDRSKRTTHIVLIELEHESLMILHRMQATVTGSYEVFRGEDIQSAVLQAIYRRELRDHEVKAIKEALLF